MKISEAAEKAYHLGWCFRRRNWSENVGIYPTNDANCSCIAVSTAQSIPIRRWQPCCEDLTANDWEVTNTLQPTLRE